MPRESNVVKQQRIGERLSRAMAKAHMDRRELAALTGYSEAQIKLLKKTTPAGLINPRFRKSISRDGGQSSPGQPCRISSANCESVAPLKLRGIAIDGHGADSVGGSLIVRTIPQP
jgi:hypothetical protein